MAEEVTRGEVLERPIRQCRCTIFAWELWAREWRTGARNGTDFRPIVQNKNTCEKCGLVAANIHQFFAGVNRKNAETRVGKSGSRHVGKILHPPRCSFAEIDRFGCGAHEEQRATVEIDLLLCPPDYWTGANLDRRDLHLNRPDRDWRAFHYRRLNRRHFDRNQRPRP
jgi:hypothetical protein